ncbi:hypothetical protein DWX88_09695 [Bacteroides xylanisolvens]|jgi:C-terminal processing protease CtpA/Prc|nr:hypothetical protein DWX88_09695 [Bacteroides xylanisolvens]
MNFLWTQILCLIVIVGVSVYIYIERKKLGFRIVSVLYLLILGGTIYTATKNYHKYWVLYHLTKKPDMQFVIDQHIEPDEYMEDFEEICDIVEKHYSLAEYKGISLKSLRDKYSVMVMNAKDNREYFLAVQQYFSEFRNSHTYLIYNKYTAPADAEWRHDSLYVSANLTGLPFKKGDRIISVDGIDVMSWRDSMMNYATGSTEKGRSVHTEDYVFSSYVDTVRNLCLCRRDSVFNVTVGLSRDGMEQISSHNKEIRDSETRRIMDSSKDKEKYFTLLSLSGFTDEDTKEFILKYNKVKDYRYIILNLMNNPGGLVRNMEKIAALLVKKPYQAETLITPSDDSFKGKLYVMIGQNTFSAAEYLASILKESGSAILVGEETSGDFGVIPLTFCTSHGTYFSLGYGKPKTTLKGEPREGKAVEPDYRVKENATLSNAFNTVRTTYYLVMKDFLKAKMDSLKKKRD